jgi:hypothetical protein
MCGRNVKLLSFGANAAEDGESEPVSFKKKPIFRTDCASSSSSAALFTWMTGSCC